MGSRHEGGFAGSGAGLSDPSTIATNDPIPTNWPTHVTTSTNVNWMSASSTGDALRWIAFDLGQPFMLSGVHVWHFNVTAESDRGMKIVDILVSSDGTSYTPVVEDITFAGAPGSSSYAGETYVFQSLANGRRARREGGMSASQRVERVAGPRRARLASRSLVRIASTARTSTRLT